MRLTKERVAGNRQKILASAERLFRLHGVSAISIADIMKDAGFTHGGFYNHFDSKEELVVEVYRVAMEVSVAEIKKLFEGCGTEAEYRARLQGSLDAYLASKRNAEPNNSDGATAMLAMDATRLGEDVQREFAAGIEQSVNVLAGALAMLEPGQVPEQERMGKARARAVLLLSGSLGALVMARSMMLSHPALADEFLQTGRECLLRGVLGVA